MIHRLTAAIATLALLSIPSAQAQERGIYAGASYGGTDYGQSVVKFDDPPGEIGPGSIVSGAGPTWRCSTDQSPLPTRCRCTSCCG